MSDTSDYLSGALDSTFYLMCGRCEHDFPISSLPKECVRIWESQDTKAVNIILTCPKCNWSVSTEIGGCEFLRWERHLGWSDKPTARLPDLATETYRNAVKKIMSGK